MKIEVTAMTTNFHFDAYFKQLRNIEMAIVRTITPAIQNTEKITCKKWQSIIKSPLLSHGLKA